MKVVYEKTSGDVVALGDVIPSDEQSSVELDKSQITYPIDGTVVDDVTNPTKTVNKLSLIKSQKKESIKNAAYGLLEPYDWYVIRKQEEGVVTPDAVSTYRNNVRSTEDTATTNVENATTAEEVRSIEPDWPSEPDV